MKTLSVEDLAHELCLPLDTTNKILKKLRLSNLGASFTVEQQHEILDGLRLLIRSSFLAHDPKTPTKMRFEKARQEKESQLNKLPGFSKLLLKEDAKGKHLLEVHFEESLSYDDQFLIQRILWDFTHRIIFGGDENNGQNVMGSKAY